MIAECYSMHLYCDNAAKCGRKDKIGLPYQWPEEIFGPDRKYCHNVAKRGGWRIRGNVSICPVCSSMGVKPSKKLEDGYMNSKS